MARPKATRTDRTRVGDHARLLEAGRIDGGGDPQGARPKRGATWPTPRSPRSCGFSSEKEFVEQTNAERPFRYQADPLLRRRVGPALGRPGEARLPRLAGTPARAADGKPQVDGEGTQPSSKRFCGSNSNEPDDPTFLVVLSPSHPARGGGVGFRLAFRPPPARGRSGDCGERTLCRRWLERIAASAPGPARA